MSDDDVEIKITISRKAFEKAARLANDEKGPAGELAGMMTAEEFIERRVEIHLEDGPRQPDLVFIQNLLVHLAEKILLMQPLTFGGDYPATRM